MNMLLSWNCVHIPRKQGHYRGDATQKSSSGGHCGWVIPTGLSEPYPAPATSQLLCLSVPLSACGPHSLGEQLSKRIFSSPMAKCMFLWTRQTWVLFLCLTQPCPWSLLLQDGWQGPSQLLWVCTCAMSPAHMGGPHRKGELVK